MQSHANIERTMKEQGRERDREKKKCEEEKKKVAVGKENIRRGRISSPFAIGIQKES